MAQIYGMNPGLIKTDIRNSMHGGGFIGKMMESVVDLFNPSAQDYANLMLPLMMAPELPKFKGAMFGQKGGAILPSPELTPVEVAKWMAAAEKLAAKALLASK